uniref:Uncharacterized protein n=1 Tax=Anguilla anguilla TaxID=7936 RepID=A0A0E9WRB6_ANGAN
MPKKKKRNDEKTPAVTSSGWSPKVSVKVT